MPSAFLTVPPDSDYIRPWRPFRTSGRRRTRSRSARVPLAATRFSCLLGLSLQKDTYPRFNSFTDLPPPKSGIRVLFIFLNKAIMRVDGKGAPGSRTYLI